MANCKEKSAKEINTSGTLDMTEMQLKLLEKVEELTLYTLAQEKTIQLQAKKMDDSFAAKQQINAKNNELQKRITSLEKLVNKLALGQN